MYNIEHGKCYIIYYKISGYCILRLFCIHIEILLRIIRNRNVKIINFIKGFNCHDLCQVYSYPCEVF